MMTKFHENRAKIVDLFVMVTYGPNLILSSTVSRIYFEVNTPFFHQIHRSVHNPYTDTIKYPTVCPIYLIK